MKDVKRETHKWLLYVWLALRYAYKIHLPMSILISNVGMFSKITTYIHHVNSFPKMIIWWAVAVQAAKIIDMLQSDYSFTTPDFQTIFALVNWYATQCTEIALKIACCLCLFRCNYQKIESSKLTPTYGSEVGLWWFSSYDRGINNKLSHLKFAVASWRAPHVWSK